MEPVQSGLRTRPPRPPHLDALAAQSLNFAACYSNCPVCMPARTALITGLFPHNTGRWGNSSDFYLPPDHMPLFADVRRQGYTTAAPVAVSSRNGSPIRSIR